MGNEGPPVFGRIGRLEPNLTALTTRATPVHQRRSKPLHGRRNAVRGGVLCVALTTPESALTSFSSCRLRGVKTSDGQTQGLFGETARVVTIQLRCYTLRRCRSPRHLESYPERRGVQSAVQTTPVWRETRTVRPNGTVSRAGRFPVSNDPQRRRTGDGIGVGFTLPSQFPVFRFRFAVPDISAPRVRPSHP
jgi:hypothetical protein